MKKALLLNWHTTSSSSLDTEISPHDIDYISMSKGYAAAGYDLWLMEPYIQKGKLSSWPRKIHRDDIHRIHEFDMIQLHWFNPYIWDWLKSKFPVALEADSQVAKNFVFLIEELHKFQGRIITTIHDPRPFYFEALVPTRDKRSSHLRSDLLKKLIDIFERVELSSAVPLIEVMKDIDVDDDLRENILSRPNWVTNYQYQLGEWYPLRPLRDENPKWDTVYIGLKQQTKIRKARIVQMLTDERRKALPGAFTGGPLVLSKIPHYLGLNQKTKAAKMMIPLDKIPEIMQECRVSVFMGEPGHWACTPRWWQAFTLGTIPAIHPSAPGAGIMPKTYARCTVDRISEIPRDRAWEIETYEILKEEMQDLTKRFPPKFERVN